MFIAESDLVLSDICLCLTYLNWMIKQGVYSVWRHYGTIYDDYMMCVSISVNRLSQLVTSLCKCTELLCEAGKQVWGILSTFDLGHPCRLSCGLRNWVWLVGDCDAIEQDMWRTTGDCLPTLADCLRGIDVDVNGIHLSNGIGVDRVTLALFQRRGDRRLRLLLDDHVACTTTWK